jgi:protein-S-isoprenylcysteine O-methyltransferase Ste14
LNVRDASSVIMFVLALCSFAALVSLPVQVSTTVTSVGETASPYVTVVGQTTVLSLIFEPYTQRITSSELVPAFKASGQNSVPGVLLGTLITALFILAAILLTEHQTNRNNPSDQP